MSNNLLRWGLGAAALLLGAASSASGQAAPPADSSLVAAARVSLGQRYARGLGTEARYYNGQEYLSYVRPNTQGHRFFGTEQALPSTLTYRGHTYPGVPLRYDLVRNQLVLAAPVGNLEMLLVNEQVAAFTLGGHSFVRLVADSAGSRAGGVPTGFYDVLVEGPVRLLAARHKGLQERPTSTGIESTITAGNDYYLYQGGHYYPVSTASSLLRLFPADKAALRAYTKANKLKVKGDTREAALVALVRYQATLAPKAAPR